MDRTSAPAAPAVSGGLPGIGHGAEFLRDPIRLLERGYREHGRVFSLRMGPRHAVVLLGPEHHQFFFRETDKRLSIRTAYPFFVRMFDERFYFFAGMDEYQRQRALVVPRFQGKQLAGYVDIMADETQALIRELGERGEFDLVHTLGPLVMRIAARSFLGEDFSRRMGDEFFAEFRRFSDGMEVVLPLWLPLPRLLRSRRARADLHAKLGELIAERRRSPIDPPDFLQTLVEARYAESPGGEGEEVPVDVLVNLLLLFAWAGHETTTGHISWALIDLLQNPHEIDALRAEQAEHIGADLDGAGLDDYRKLRRMDWALHETERLHPVAYILMRSAAVDIDHAGIAVPKGTMVMVAPAVAHRLPELFPEPDRFLPDRFAGQDEPPGLIGFGGGLHRCLGMHFAYLEMRVVLSLLLAHYDFELVDTDVKPVAGPKTKWPASPCRVRYRARQPVTTRL
ncbi:MAG TPA: cytochrome P450 [Acidimicrobiia bacterium]|nr:cytochrome P450 [Acidimicrobiia bacterium]